MTRSAASPRLPGAILAVALLCLLAGCGGSSGSSSAETSSPHQNGAEPEAGGSSAGGLIADVYGDEPFECPADQARASAAAGVPLITNPGVEGSEVQCGYIDSVHAGSMHVVVNFRFDPGEVVSYDREQVEALNAGLQCKYRNQPNLGAGAFGAACSGPDDAVTGTVYFQMPDGSRTWVVEVGNIAGAEAPFTPDGAEKSALELVTHP